MSRQDELVNLNVEAAAALGDEERPRRGSRGRRRRTAGQRTDRGAITFEAQWLNECGAMLRYASTRGMEIPAKAAYTVRELDNKRSRHGKDGDGWVPVPRDSNARLSEIGSQWSRCAMDVSGDPTSKPS